MRKSIVAAALAALMSCAPAAAANLIVNGGFETGDFSGWAEFGDDTFDYVLDGSYGVAPPNGAYMAFFGAESGYSGIVQTFATTPGASYDVSFLLENTYGYDNAFKFSFDGVDYIDAYGLAPLGFQSIARQVIASGDTAEVRFSFRNPSWYFLLDDVSVTASVPTPSAVPEVATWGLMISGFAMVGAAMRRRRRAVAPWAPSAPL